MSLFSNLLPQSSRAQKSVITLWLMAIVAVPIWSQLDASGWDLAVYRSAVHALRIGHDPYADATAIQVAYHQQLALHPNITSDPPYNYVYSPITLPLLRVIGQFPDWLSSTAYWIVDAIGAIAIVWVGMQAVEDGEREYFAFFAPIAIFFPGLLENGVILSGNIAYIIYGAALVAAVLGWTKGRWGWFYLIVLIASCFKAPLLSLLAIPVLSAVKQWLPAGLTAAAGISLFIVQPALWPSLFRHYLQAIELQFSFNRDFGSSPSGIFAGLLFDHGIPYAHGGLIFYLLYVVPLLGFLLYLSRRFIDGAFPLTRWMPVLLVGIILMNPRIIEYDLAILSIPLALIIWRALPALKRSRVSAVLALLIFSATNLAAYQSWLIWKDIECLILVLLFVFGSWDLLHQHKRNEAQELLLVARGQFTRASSRSA